MGEEGCIGGTLARLGLQTYPSVRGPGKTHIAEGVAKAVPSLVVGIARIGLQSLFGHVAKDAIYGFLVVLGRHIAWSEEGTLVGVGHHNDGNIIILATLVEAILVVADDITIDAGPETGKAHVAIAERHRIELAHLLEMFLESQTLFFGTLLRGIHAQ